MEKIAFYLLLMKVSALLYLRTSVRFVRPNIDQNLQIREVKNVPS